MYMHPIIELIVRYVYFGLNFRMLFEKKKKSKKKSIKIGIKEIEEKMKSLGINKGDTIMIHSSFSVIDDTAENFIEFLKRYIGPQGNILMPTHPKLYEENGTLVYDIVRSPSTVGHLTEVFRKTEGVRRSEHPFSSVAVWGKDADFFLEDNLNNNKPLPHGRFSPYYKFAQKGGKVICIGVRAIRSGTIRHVAEEVLDEKYPVKDLFLERKVIVKENNEHIKTVIVRELDLSKSQIFIAKSKIEKEWLENDILIKESINGIPFEVINAKKCVDFMIDEARKGKTSYPYAPKKKSLTYQNVNFH